MHSNRGQHNPVARFIAIIALTSGACGPCARPVNSPPKQTEGASPRVIVVGGGLAGLVTAYELQKHGITAHILEASESWGGRVATAHYAGDLHAEYGMQEIWAGTSQLSLARDLKVPLVEPAESAFSSVIIDGRLHPFVQGTNDAFLDSLFSKDERTAFDDWLGRARALRKVVQSEGLKNSEVEDLQNRSFGDWVRERKLPRKVEEFIRLTIECELAADWESFSGVIGLLEFGVFLDQADNYRVQGGNIRLIEALTNAIGGPKTLSATVLAVRREQRADGSIHARVTYMRAGQVETIEAERVVLAVPFFRLHQIDVTPPLSADKWQGIYTLGRGGYTVVHLIVDKGTRKLTEVEGKSPFPILTDGPLGVIYGVVDETPSSQPREVFSLLVNGLPAHAFHMIPREEKLREIRAKLDALWPGFSTHIQESYVYTYHPAAVAVWPPGRSPIDEPAQAIREPEMGLYLAGDWTVSAHATGAVESGLRVAGQIASDLSFKHQP
jgi:monoamine oxidase